MSLTPDLSKRIDALLERGGGLLSRRRHERDYGPEYWMDAGLIPDAQAWMTSSANLVSLTTIPGSYFRDELERITTNKELAG
ncbi:MULTISPECIES: hypothetical protein [unclassified Simplicispira]|uniref:hypothetical protein n=1 Tax=unclassified Simplicispira TaxID=2630407 RepID=UPI000E283061|nr:MULTISPECIES: hypothetical protein [unclassified Simplicispira]